MIFLFFLCATLLISCPSEAAAPSAPKYVLIFLADGGSLGQLEIARLYNRQVHQQELVITGKIMKEGFYGSLTTHSADRLVTDSAAAATAMAGGCKARNGAVGICYDGSIPETVMERARKNGMGTGLITNAPIYDASPAAFIAHVRSRGDYGSILEQYLKFTPELVLGGGRDRFLPQSRTGTQRRDEGDPILLFKAKGYHYVSNRAELKEARGPKVLGLFHPGEMSFEHTRGAGIEPSLSEMAEAALRILHAHNPRGFVLFVESEHIDSAAHQTDAPSLIHAVREFDRTVKLGYEFYKKFPAETLLLVTSDHDTGGLGLTGAASARDLKKLQSVRTSFGKAARLLGERPTVGAIDRLMAEHFSGFVLPIDLKEAILKRKTLGPPFPANPTAAALSAMVSRQIHVSWVSSGHTNQPVFVAALGVGAQQFRGYQDNTDFGRHLLTLLQAKRSR
ncbi:MAG: alkaline phosphatase [Deltaproteobacteria bacterium]|nr:alkaline phosphatase [Deltaproteobacteria bacterium]